jgi:hypothetical protein
MRIFRSAPAMLLSQALDCAAPRGPNAPLQAAESRDGARNESLILVGVSDAVF